MPANGKIGNRGEVMWYLGGTEMFDCYRI